MENKEQNQLCAVLRAGLTTPLETRLLLAHFGSPTALAAASAAALEETGLSPRRVAKLLAALRYLDPAAEAARLAQEGIVAVAEDDPRYPPLLAEIPDAPPLLFVRGDSAPLADPLALAVVGTRRMSCYGRAAVRLLVAPAVDAGLVVVSGLAFGVDASAHQLAVDRRRPTVAVLASGVDRASVGPRANARLAEEIIERGGCLVSEYPPGAPASPRTFPQRNRLIAGLASVTLVVEAAEKSGSLITARYALEFGRDVLAVPGPITADTSAGPNRLLAGGAKPALAPNDLLEEYAVSLPAAAPPSEPEDEEGKTVLAALRAGHACPDFIAEETGLPIRAVLMALAELEAAGLAQAEGEAWVAA